jgi:hypothetical protein
MVIWVGQDVLIFFGNEQNPRSESKRICQNVNVTLQMFRPIDHVHRESLTHEPLMNIFHRFMNV